MVVVHRWSCVAMGLGILCGPALASEPWRVFRGAADASAAVWLGEGAIAVADDEDNLLRVYDADRGGLPRSSLDVSGFLRLAADEEADIEGASRAGDRIYWISSHRRSRSGRMLEGRHRFFATGISRTKGDPVLHPVGRPCTDLLPAVGRALESVLGDTIGQATPIDLGAVDIEALGGDPDGRTLWIGLRSPVARSEGTLRAIVVPLRNAAGIVERGEPPQLGKAVRWDLDGRSLRDMTWADHGGSAFLLASAVDRGAAWRLYRWAGGAAVPPQVVTCDGPPGLGSEPEAIVELGTSGRLLILTDDGERRVAVEGPEDCKRGEYRPDGTCRNKGLRRAERKSFRGFEVAP